MYRLYDLRIRHPDSPSSSEILCFLPGFVSSFLLLWITMDLGVGTLGSIGSQRAAFFLEPDSFSDRNLHVRRA